MAPGALLAPGASHAAFERNEVDERAVPWSDIGRLALEGGFFPPPYRPVTAAELTELLAGVEDRALSGGAPALTDDSEYARLGWLLDRYARDGGGTQWHGCPCKTYPPHVRLSGRVLGGFSGLGDPVPGEGGLGFTAGHNVFLEPAIEFAAGNFWSAFSVRVGGRWADGGVDFNGPGGAADPLAWPGWQRATGRADVRDLRLDDGSWHGQVTRALVGLQLGNWALSAGWDQRRTGPALTGDLNLDDSGRAIPALTARRTAPFRWQGVMTHLAPDQLLLRTGVLSSRTVSYRDEFGSYSKEAAPWFFQWLVGWNITPWFRTHFTHSVMATARDGSLWPDLLQVLFPIVGTTWREQASGPITDRIFAIQFEARWREAPWPLLPSRAGRVYWDYGGTDFLPTGPGGVVPQIAAPASLVGCELLGPRWDLGAEYAELRHETVLWYSNGGYDEGYSQQQTLLGHPLGGSGEAVTALVRMRPAGWGTQLGLQGRWAHWGDPGQTPGTGERHSLALTVGRTSGGPALAGDAVAAPLLWELTLEWNREAADPSGHLNYPPPGSRVERDWWRLIYKIGI